MHEFTVVPEEKEGRDLEDGETNKKDGFAKDDSNTEDSPTGITTVSKSLDWKITTTSVSRRYLIATSDTFMGKLWLATIEKVYGSF